MEKYPQQLIQPNFQPIMPAQAKPAQAKSISVTLNSDLIDKISNKEDYNNSNFYGWALHINKIEEGIMGNLLWIGLQVSFEKNKYIKRITIGKNITDEQSKKIQKASGIVPIREPFNVPMTTNTPSTIQNFYNRIKSLEYDNTNLQNENNLLKAEIRDLNEKINSDNTLSKPMITNMQSTDQDQNNKIKQLKFNNDSLRIRNKFLEIANKNLEEKIKTANNANGTLRDMVYKQDESTTLEKTNTRQKRARSTSSDPVENKNHSNEQQTNHVRKKPRLEEKSNSGSFQTIQSTLFPRVLPKIQGNSRKNQEKQLIELKKLFLDALINSSKLSLDIMYKFKNDEATQEDVEDYSHDSVVMNDLDETLDLLEETNNIEPNQLIDDMKKNQLSDLIIKENPEIFRKVMNILKDLGQNHQFKTFIEKITSLCAEKSTEIDVNKFLQ